MRVLRTIVAAVFVVLAIAGAAVSPVLVAAAGKLSFFTPDQTVRIRGARGAVVRSPARRRDFAQLTGQPEWRTGYAVDHILPVDPRGQCGGSDTVGNMEWLTIAEWRRKSSWERLHGCRLWRDGTFTRLLQFGIDACAAGTGPAEPCAALKEN